MILSLQIRNYKVYGKNSFIRLGDEDTAFTAVIGKNGVGKSTLLEALDTVFNNKEWKLNSSSKSKKEDSYIAVVFAMNENILSHVNGDTAFSINRVLKRMPEEFLAQKSTNNEAALKLRAFLDSEDVPEYIGIVGKAYDVKSGKRFYAGDLVHEFVIEGLQKEMGLDRSNAEEHFVAYCKGCLEGVSYTYISVEDGIPELLKIEAQLMEKILPQDIVSGITEILDERRITVHTQRRGRNPRKSTVGLINEGLNELSKDISATVKSVDDSYSYKHISSSRNLTSKDLADAILRSFFASRSFVKDGLPVERLSSGEKRMALLDIVFSFLRKLERSKLTVLAVDEPETSLHVSSSFDQFRKLIRIAEDANCQVLCTSHWYGFIPVVKSGAIVYLDSNSASYFLTEDFVPGNNKIPTDVLLKSGFELAGSIINSIKGEEVKWVICEGVTDKKYLETIFENDQAVRVVTASNDITVINLFKQLSMSLKGVNRHLFSGSVMCLIDTDSDTPSKMNGMESFSDVEGVLQFRRLNILNNEIRLSPLGEKRFQNCCIEDILCAKTVARVISSEIGKKFEGDCSAPLVFNSHYPAVRVHDEGVDLYDGMRMLRKFIFSDSLDSRIVGKAKKVFCDLFVSGVNADEKQWMRMFWKELSGW